MTKILKKYKRVIILIFKKNKILFNVLIFIFYSIMYLILFNILFDTIVIENLLARIFLTLLIINIIFFYTYNNNSKIELLKIQNKLLNEEIKTSFKNNFVYLIVEWRFIWLLSYFFVKLIMEIFGLHFLYLKILSYFFLTIFFLLNFVNLYILIKIYIKRKTKFNRLNIKKEDPILNKKHVRFRPIPSSKKDLVLMGRIIKGSCITVVGLLSGEVAISSEIYPDKRSNTGYYLTHALNKTGYGPGINHKDKNTYALALQMLNHDKSNQVQVLINDSDGLLNPKSMQKMAKERFNINLVLDHKKSVVLTPCEEFLEQIIKKNNKTK